MLFSIVIPNYNSEQWIRRLMESIKSQTFKDYELIVVDDISTDNSFNILADYQYDNDFYMKLELFQNTYKRYNGGTRNAGVEMAKGDYIIFADCDDYFYKSTCLEQIAKVINKDRPDCVRLSYKYEVPGGIFKMMLKEDTPQSLCKSIFCAPWTKCIKRDLYVPFPENTLLEDVSQHIEQCDKINTISVCNIPIIIWNRLNEKAISNPTNEQKSTKRLASYWRVIADLMDLEGKLEHDWAEEHRKWRLNNYLQIAKEKLDGIQ